MQFQFDDDEDDDDKKGPPPPPLLNFADIECALSEDRVFQPNPICWSSEKDEEIPHARTIDEFLEACKAMTEVEDNERPRKVITFFHNLRGFDGNFILEALYYQGRAVENPLTQGPKFCILKAVTLFLKIASISSPCPWNDFPLHLISQSFSRGTSRMPSIAQKILIMQEITHSCLNRIQTVWTARKEKSL